MTQKQVTFFNKLIEDLIHNLIYYIPSEIIFEQVLDQLKGDIEEDFLDELSLLDSEYGIAQIENEDAMEVNSRLLDKKSLLEQNLTKISKIKKKLTEQEFEVFCDKYVDQLRFYVFIAEWLSSNLKKYNEKDLHFSIIGAFKLQYEYLHVHLKSFYGYFKSYINIEIEGKLTAEKLVSQYIPDLISRYNQSSISHPSKKKKKKDKKVVSQEVIQKTNPKKKERPSIDDKKIENMVLEVIFKVKVDL